MLGLDLVAGLTIKRDMMRDRFCSRNLGVAGSACLWDLGWRRIVRIVTTDARLERIVQAFDDLREAGWSRGQVFVTGETGRSPLSRNQRRLGLIVLAVNGRRSMAMAAGQVVVKAAWRGVGCLSATTLRACTHARARACTSTGTAAADEGGDSKRGQVRIIVVA